MLLMDLLRAKTHQIKVPYNKQSSWHKISKTPQILQLIRYSAREHLKAVLAALIRIPPPNGTTLVIEVVAAGDAQRSSQII